MIYIITITKKYIITIYKMKYILFFIIIIYIKWAFEMRKVVILFFIVIYYVAYKRPALPPTNITIFTLSSIKYILKL